MKNITLILLFGLIACFSFAQNGGNSEKSQLLYKSATDLYSAKKFAEAGAKYEEALKLAPTNSYAAFNAACSYSLAENKTKATEMAMAAYKLGMMGFDSDKDFDNVRSHAPFAKLATKAREEIAQLNSLPPKSALVVPEVSNDNKSLIVVFHGYGGKPEGIISAYSFAANKYNSVVLAIRATEVDGRESFHWNFSDEEESRILKEINDAVKKYDIDKSKIVLTGFSQGGYLSWNFGLQNSEMFCGLLPVAGSYDKQKTDLTKVTNKNIKVYSIIGKKDNPKYEASNMEAVKLGNELGLKFKVKNFYNIGHTYPDNEEYEISKALDWLLK